MDKVPLEDLANAAYITQRVQMAATALITYDFFLTLALEVRLVWHGRWGVPSVLFMVNRYGVLVYSLVSASLLNLGLSRIPATALNQDFLTTFICEFWSTLGGWSIPVITLLVEAMLVMRVVALCGSTKTVAVPLWGLYACCFAASIVLVVLEVENTKVMGVQVPTQMSQASCNLQGSTKITWALWIPGLVMETTLVVFTGIRSFQYSWNGISTPLLALLTRDGFMYFLSVFVLMLANVVICSTPLFIYYSVLVEPALSLSSVLGNRLFLNLRYTAAEDQKLRLPVTTAGSL